MFEWLGKIYSYCSLGYNLYSYVAFLNQYNEHNTLLLEKLIHSIKICGAVTIKFSQWVIPKLEMMYCKDILSNEYQKPEWLLMMEGLYEDCYRRDVREAYDEYSKVFNQKFSDTYDIIDIVGSGSIGQVYLIEKRKDKQKFIMKVRHASVVDDIKFFKHVYDLIYKIPNIKKKINKIFPFDILKFIENFNEQANFINEANHLIYFNHEYKDNKFICIPKLYRCSESVLIMSYEEGISYDNLQLNNYQKYKIVNLFHLFVRNNESVINYNHGDLHKGNWRIKIGEKHNQLIIYDFGFCYTIPDEKFNIIDLICNTLESADNENETNLENLQEILHCIIIYDTMQEKEMKRKIKHYVIENKHKVKEWVFSPINLVTMIKNFCILENILMNPVLIQFIIVFIQTQRLFHEFSFHGSDENQITAYKVYRERYLDLLTFCKTHNIFSALTQLIEDILNKKQIHIQKIFDSIDYDEDISDELTKLAVS